MDPVYTDQDCVRAEIRWTLKVITPGQPIMLGMRLRIMSHNKAMLSINQELISHNSKGIKKDHLKMFNLVLPP